VLTHRCLNIGLLAIAALLGAAALATAAPARASATGPGAHQLLASRELWATIDVCSPARQPNTVGIRGSMPGDRQSRDKMYMSFRLQYLNSATQRWIDLVTGASPNYVAVGAGASARQGGRSFKLIPVAGKPAVTLRGVVDFQWRRGRTILLTASRPTTAGHTSLAGPEPANFSAASCQIG